MGNYQKYPSIAITATNEVIVERNLIAQEILKHGAKRIIVECYPGIDIDSLATNFKNLMPEYELIHIDNYSLPVKTIQKKIVRNITDDRVFGFMSNHQIEEFYDQEIIENLDKQFANQKVIVYGFGAIQLFNEESLLIHATLTRWEIQKRLRKGYTNWKTNNPDEEATAKFKRGYFFEWRVADRIKKRLYEKFNYILDLNDPDSLKLLPASQYRLGLRKAMETPFRLVPFFDPGVWGGKWMMEKFDLPKDVPNYAWSFDGVVEENSIRLQYNDQYIEIPAIDLVFFEPIKLLGESVHARFGTEFPIRFDFLDTMDGQNLSLQVHPLTEYIQEKFGMNYTQDESYYILDAKDKAYVYLGVKENITQQEMISELKAAQNNKTKFNDEKFINKIPCKKHDHFLIPAGTIHCSGKDTMVLEISATPYIFTFKLWDWDRVGLDGNPRPIHLEHGEQVINFDYDTNYVNKNFINQFKKISEYEEKTGLHERQFIETRRFFTSEPILHQTNGVFQMLNLIEGESITIVSPTKQFMPYTINYAETFIIPANIKEYQIIPNNGKVGYIKAYVRVNNE